MARNHLLVLDYSFEEIMFRNLEALGRINQGSYSNVAHQFSCHIAF